MAQEREILDITDNPDLLRIAEEVRRSKTPRVLRAGDEDVAVVMPVADRTERRRKRAKTEADYQAFLDSAGSWADVDVDEFRRYIRERRDTGDRPPVEL
jgi:hypothetical protein